MRKGQSYFIKTFKSSKSNLYSLVNSHIIADDPIKKYVIALYMWQLSAGKEEHLLYQNKYKFHQPI